MSARSRLAVEMTEGAFRISQGELRLTIFAVKDLADVEHPADFVIRLDEILTWDMPHDDQEISVEELQKIAAEITEECERHGLSVAFE
ncbi:MAG: Imm74 family immunity protein [Methylovirgula sp.]|uniref:Imm74 family immunity protein n=1 Tax=Methylovirgula sp. TaxID=1978224 RepID=UPI003076341F